MMKILFLQIEEFVPEKINALITDLDLHENDQIYSPFFSFIDCADRSRVYESTCLFQYILKQIQEIKTDIVLLEDNPYSRFLAVKIAYEMKMECLTNVKDIQIIEDGKYSVSLYAYQSNVTCCTECSGPMVITMHLSDKADPERCCFVNTEEVQLKPDHPIGEMLAKKGDVNTLKQAKTVFVCGQGVGSKENAQIIADLAGSFHAAVGATRPVVANGWLPPECLIGISGSLICPDLCVVFGASGSQAFMAGITGSKKIISINNDPSAAVFCDSDTGIVFDCMEFAALLKQERK